MAPTMRSYGVRLWVVGQDLEQFEKVYEKSWGTFIGNAEAVQFMGITHPPTVAYLAFNTQRPLFRDNPWLRRAINYALDRRILARFFGK